MGWSYSCLRSFGKKDLVAKATEPGYLSPGYNLLTHRVVGNNLWYLYTRPDGTKTIGLTMMASGGSDMGWGSKGMSEDSGSYELNCPLALLDEADPAGTEFAAGWRDSVREFHRQQQELKTAWSKLALGTSLEHNGVVYTVERPPSKGQTKAVVRRADGQLFKLARRIFASCKTGSPKPKAESVVEQNELFT